MHFRCLALPISQVVNISWYNHLTTTTLSRKCVLCYTHLFRLGIIENTSIFHHCVRDTTYFIVVSRHRCMYARYVHQVTSLHENILKASWRIHHFCFILFVLILYSRSYILFYFLIIMLKIHIFIFYSM